MWTLVLSCVRVCTYRCLCTTSSPHVKRSAQNYTTTQSKQIFEQTSVTFLDLQIQNGDSSALVLTLSHPIGHSEIHTLWGLHNVILPPPTPSHRLPHYTIRLRRLKKDSRETLVHSPEPREDPLLPDPTRSRSDLQTWTDFILQERTKHKIPSLKPQSR